MNRVTREEFALRIEGMQDGLYRVAYGLLLNQADCADAVQESIFKAWRGIRTLREEKHLRTWLTRILINECYMMLRKRRKELPLMEEMIEAMPADSSDPALFEAIAALDEALRLAVVLHYIEGYATKEIATMLRCPEGTIKSRLRRARQRMRELMERERGSHDGKP